MHPNWGQFGRSHLCSTHSPQFRIFCWLVKFVFMSSRRPDEWIVSVEDLYTWSTQRWPSKRNEVDFFPEKSWNCEVMFNTEMTENSFWIGIKPLATDKDNQQKPCWTLSGGKTAPSLWNVFGYRNIANSRRSSQVYIYIIYRYTKKHVVSLTPTFVSNNQLFKCLKKDSKVLVAL